VKTPGGHHRIPEPELDKSLHRVEMGTRMGGYMAEKGSFLLKMSLKPSQGYLLISEKDRFY
jgi:hypothetical protein